MRHVLRRRGRLALSAAVLAMVLAAVGLASAQTGGSGPSDEQRYAGVPTEARTAIEELCGEGPPCVVIPGSADHRPDPAPDVLRAGPTGGEQLAATGIPASDCPEVKAVYEAAGYPVDAFTGSCPTLAEARDHVKGIDPADTAAVLDHARKAHQ
jgi:hypothetical protein